MRTQVDHLAPTAVGGVVTAEATLEKVEGRRLTFTVSVNDRCGLVAAGKVTRVIVDRERFLAKARG
jgi:fluoroacetyl-CoA thioesterase